MNKQEVVRKIEENGAIAVLRLEDAGKLLNVANAIFDGGVTNIEITMTVPNALKIIEEVANSVDEGMLIGVGSVLDSETAQKAIDAGANYVVSPVLKKEIIEVAHKNDCPALPGAFTPTEIQQAYEWGADVVKVFPADVVGMKYFKSIKAPMPHLKLMPTGGVSLTNAGDWLAHGACAVGIGSALLDQQAVKNNDYTKLTVNAKLLMKSINQYRQTLKG